MVTNFTYNDKFDKYPLDRKDILSDPSLYIPCTIGINSNESSKRKRVLK